MTTVPRIQHTVSPSFFFPLILTESWKSEKDSVFISSLTDPYFIWFQKVLPQVKTASWHQDTSLWRKSPGRYLVIDLKWCNVRILALGNQAWVFCWECYRDQSEAFWTKTCYDSPTTEGQTIRPRDDVQLLRCLLDLDLSSATLDYHHQNYQR